MDDVHVEGAPSSDQKERLEDFLTELMLLSRRYGILLSDNSESVEIIDMPSGNLVGLGVAWFTAPDDDHKVLSYLPANSILDGVWPVDTPDGTRDQRLIQGVNPVREAPA